MLRRLRLKQKDGFLIKKHSIILEKIQRKNRVALVKTNIIPSLFKSCLRKMNP